ncbi:NAD kinase [Rickettsiales bacterium LUAb2]
MKLAVIHSKDQKCEYLLNFLKKNHALVKPEDADIIICLGGDGFMLHTLHNYLHLNVPIYGINCGHLGFLMNENNGEEDLIRIKEKITISKSITLHPLEIKFKNTNNEEFTSLAFNEASLLRHDGVAAHLNIFLNNELKLKKLTSDGILVSTPVGSTAYNKACGGPQVPLESNLMILTAINAFSPLSFKSAVVDDTSLIKIEVIDPIKRKVNLFCDFIKYENIISIEIIKSKSKSITLLFDHNNNLSNKTLNAQFSH